IRGESGSGKTALARWLWKHSVRKDGPFVSSLRTDARKKMQEAIGGTLFLDEIGDLSLEDQARLLNVLDEQPDVRLIAASNQNLEEEARQGRFREDLLFRLNVVTLPMPALRERTEDLLPLARQFLAAAAARQHRPVFELS